MIKEPQLVARLSFITKLMFSPPPGPDHETHSFSEAHRGDEFPAIKPRICENFVWSWIAPILYQTITRVDSLLFYEFLDLGNLGSRLLGLS